MDTWQIYFDACRQVDECRAAELKMRLDHELFEETLRMATAVFQAMTYVDYGFLATAEIPDGAMLAIKPCP